MSRQVAPLLDWVEGDGRQDAGPHTIRFHPQDGWQLVAHGRSAGTYASRSAAQHAAAALHRRRGVRRRLARWLVVGGIASVVLVVALPRQSEPNPEYPPTRAFADRVDQAQSAVEAGEVSIDEVAQVFGGLEGSSFEHRGLRKLALAGVLDGDCYGIVWRPGFHPSVVYRSDYVSCEPDSSLIDQPDPRGLAPIPMAPSWEYTLPTSDRTPVWFIPVVAIFGAVLLGAGSRAATLVVALRR